MKETIFNDIYNQYQPDKELVNRLMERVKNEKPKAVPFKAVITVASAAAGLALCFAAWKLLPSGPNIEVVNPAVMTTTTTTYKSSIITNTDPILTLETPPGATTAPCYGPWDETTTTAYETTTATNSSWEETVPRLWAITSQGLITPCLQAVRHAFQALFPLTISLRKRSFHTLAVRLFARFPTRLCVLHRRKVLMHMREV